MDIALSDNDVVSLVNGSARVILYPDLHKFSSISEVLGDFDACFLLFESRPNYGHWTCLIRRGNDLEFFNPYGGWPDDSLKFIPLKFRRVSNQNVPYLSLLMIDSHYTLYYNEFDFQRMIGGVRTCGRHCVVRIRNIGLDIYQYKDYLDSVIRKNGLRNYDEAVLYLTS